MHDYDENKLLDGLEIIAAIAHILPHDPDLDLGKGMAEGMVLDTEHSVRLRLARERHDAQMFQYHRKQNLSLNISIKTKKKSIDFVIFDRQKWWTKCFWMRIWTRTDTFLIMNTSKVAGRQVISEHRHDIVFCKLYASFLGYAFFFVL